MVQITAAAVNNLRNKTGLPMMDCKVALTEAQGDEEKAIRILRERGAKVLGARSDRETSFGRFGLYTSATVGAMVELKCESAPVTQTDEFIQFANDLAKQLATGPGAATADDLLKQPSPCGKGTLGERKQEMFNRIREVFNVGRMIRIEGKCGGYSHNASTVAGVLLQYEGGNEAVAKDVCMHIAAMRPVGLNKEDVPAEEVEKERSILREAALKEGKPVVVVEKMVEGRMRSFFGERVLTEQAFVKDNNVTVGDFARQNGMKLNKFVNWELGK